MTFVPDPSRKMARPSGNSLAMEKGRPMDEGSDPPPVSKPPSLSGCDPFHKLDGFLVPSHAGVIMCHNEVLRKQNR